MKRHEQDELLKELLTGEEVSEFRQASLENGLAALRQQQRRRHAAKLGAMMVFSLLLLLAAVLIHRQSGPKVREVASVKPPAAAAASKQSDSSGMKIISDEELFALFPGRSMALVGEPGEQHVVFLDGGVARALVR